MQDEQIEKVIEKVLERQKSEPCPLGIDEEQHRREHNFLRGMIKLAEKLEHIKWGFLGSVVRSIGMFLIAALFVGLIVLIKKQGADW